MTPQSKPSQDTKAKSKRIRSKEYKEKQRLKKKAKRDARTPEERKMEAALRKAKRDLKTPEEKELESKKRAAARKAKRASLTSDEWEKALQQKATSTKAYQSSMTLQQKQHFNQQHALKKAQKRPEQRLARNHQRDQNRAHFQMKTFKNHPDSFHAFEDHPETSVLLYHLNSGHEKFRDVDYLTKNEAADDKPDQPHSSHMEALLNEITAETLTLEENEKLLKKYLSSQGRSTCQLPNNDSIDQSLQGLPASIDAHHLVCGACGMKCINGQYGRFCTVVPLSDLPVCLQLTDKQSKAYDHLKNQQPLLLPTDDEGTIKPFYLHKLHSVYESQLLQKKYHLHPEFVHMAPNSTCSAIQNKQELTVLCPSCSSWLQDVQKKQKKDNNVQVDPPPNSLASGLDFGDATRLGLEEPNTVEMILIAKVRHFHNVVKIQNNHTSGGRTDFTKSILRGHSILFQHEAPIVASLALILENMLHATHHPTSHANTANQHAFYDLKKLFATAITIQLVGPQYSKEKLIYNARMQTTIKARAYIIYQRLAILQHCHSLYADDPKIHNICEFSQFQKAVEECNEKTIDNAVHVHNNRALLAEKILGDDVAHMRTGIMKQADLDSLKETTEKVSNEMKLTYSYVCNPDDALFELTDEPNIEEPQTNAEQTTALLSAQQSDITKQQTELIGNTRRQEVMKSYMQEIANAFNIEMPTKKENTSDHDPDVWQSTREEEPLNEFEDMQELLVGAFPQVFLLGKTYPERSLLNAVQMEHLLLQYTNVAATNRELMFYLYDCQSRHKILHNLATKIKKDPDAFDKYAELVQSDKFKHLIEEAARDTSSEAAETVLETILPVLTFAARNNVVAGSLGDKSSLSRTMANTRRYGPVNSLITVTPDDINNPTSLRFACRSINNISFPAIADAEFFKQLHEGGILIGEGDVKMPLHYTKRSQMATENPVSVALEYRTMIENIIQILFGCPLDYQPGTNSGQKRTWYYRSDAPNCPRHKGIFGHLLAFSSFTETQARGGLHFHLVFHGGITPKLLEKGAPFPIVCKQIQKALDSMYTAEIPRSMHVADMIMQQMKTTSQGRALLPKFAKTYPTMHHVPSPHLREK